MIELSITQHQAELLKELTVLIAGLRDLYESAAEEYDPTTASIGFTDALINAEEILGIEEKDSVLWI